MKAVIVKAGTVAKYNRLDAGFYLAQVEGRDATDRVDYYRDKVVSATNKLQAAIDDMVEAAARQRRMIDDGEVVPLE